MTAKAGKGLLSTSEWVCGRHGFQLVPGGTKATAKPKCKWCGTVLSLNTWVMNG